MSFLGDIAETELPSFNKPLGDRLKGVLSSYIAKRDAKTITIQEAMDFYNLVLEGYAKSSRVPLETVRAHWTSENVTVQDFVMPAKGKCAIRTCTEQCVENSYNQTYVMFSPNHTRFTMHPLPLESSIQFPEPDIEAITSGKVAYRVLDVLRFLFRYKCRWSLQMQVDLRYLDWPKRDYDDETRVFRKFTETRGVDKAEIEKRGWKEPELRKCKRGILLRTDFGIMRVAISMKEYLCSNARGYWCNPAKVDGAIVGGSWFHFKFVPLENISARTQEQLFMFQSEPLKDDEPHNDLTVDELAAELTTPPQESLITPSKMPTPLTEQYKKVVNRAVQKINLRDARSAAMTESLSGQTKTDDTGQQQQLSPMVQRYLANQKIALDEMRKNGIEQDSRVVTSVIVPSADRTQSEVPPTVKDELASEALPAMPVLQVPAGVAAELFPIAGAKKAPRAIRGRGGGRRGTGRTYTTRKRPNTKIQKEKETPEEARQSTRDLVGFYTNSPALSTTTTAGSTKKRRTKVEKMMETVTVIANEGDGASKKVGCDMSRTLSLLAESIDKLDVHMENEKRKNIERNTQLLRSVQDMLDVLKNDFQEQIRAATANPVIISDSQVEKIKLAIMEKCAELVTETTFDMLKQYGIATRLTIEKKQPPTGWKDVCTGMANVDLSTVKIVEPRNRGWSGITRPDFAEILPPFAMQPIQPVTEAGAVIGENLMLDSPVIPVVDNNSMIKHNLISQIMKYSAGASVDVLKNHTAMELQNFLRKLWLKIKLNWKNVGKIDRFFWRKSRHYVHPPSVTHRLCKIILHRWKRLSLLLNHWL